MADQPSPRRRFQFRLRTLMIGVTLAAIVAAVASRIAYEQRMRNLIVGKWICDFHGHKNGYSVIFSRTRVNSGINLPNPPLDRAGGGYSFNTVDRTVELTIMADIGGTKMERFTRHGRLEDDDTLILFEGEGGEPMRLKRDRIGVWAQ